MTTTFVMHRLLRTSNQLFLTSKITSRKINTTNIINRTKDAIEHTWTSSKLFATEIKTTTSLVKDMMSGSMLTRREKRQVVRTGTDMLRLVPFSLFLVIPFMEFLLPFAVRFFPWILPSPFKSKNDIDNSIVNRAQVRLETAKILRQTLKELTDTKKNIDDDQTVKILEKIRQKRQIYLMTTDEVLQIAKLFKSDITLDNMNRKHLVSMCNHLSIPTFGSAEILRYQLRSKIKDIVEDDRMILWEGIDSLEKDELQQACIERGMPFVNLSIETYRDQMKSWLDMSMNKNISPSLMILSHAFTGEQNIQEAFKKEAIADAIHKLDEKVVDEVKVDIVMDTADQNEKLEKIKEVDQIERTVENISIPEIIKDIEIERSKGKEKLSNDIEESESSTNIEKTKQVLSKVLDNLQDDVDKLKLEGKNG